jgi:hypothetical protein
MKKDALLSGRLRKNAFKVYHYNPYISGSLLEGGTGGLTDSRTCNMGTVHMHKMTKMPTSSDKRETMKPSDTKKIQDMKMASKNMSVLSPTLDAK